MKPLMFTIFQISWAIIWAAEHIKIRRHRRYAGDRARVDTNNRYRVVSYFLYLAQNVLCIASFWSDSQFLLKLHDSDSMRLAGVLLISLATALYFKALASLDRNYSPCFDSHLPFELIRTGPYKFTRHPMYLAKLLIVIGNFVISGSLWFVPLFMYLLMETIGTIAVEEKYLTASMKGYIGYKKRTTRMIPFLF